MVCKQNGMSVTTKYHFLCASRYRVLTYTVAQIISVDVYLLVSCVNTLVMVLSTYIMREAISFIVTITLQIINFFRNNIIK